MSCWSPRAPTKSSGPHCKSVLTEYAANIYDTARALPGADQFPDDTFAALVAILTNTFDGAAIVRAVLPQPEIEDKRIELLAALLSGLRSRASAPRAPGRFCNATARASRAYFNSRSLNRM